MKSLTSKLKKGIAVAGLAGSLGIATACEPNPQGMYALQGLGNAMAYGMVDEMGRQMVNPSYGQPNVVYVQPQEERREMSLEEERRERQEKNGVYVMINLDNDEIKKIEGKFLLGNITLREVEKRVFPKKGYLVHEQETGREYLLKEELNDEDYDWVTLNGRKTFGTPKKQRE